MAGTTYPHVRISGSPLQRGRRYGEQARDRIARSVEAYGAVFEELAGLRWPDVLAFARPFAGAIERFDARYLEEMRGLAEGAGQELAAILALNVRSEIMLSAKAREARQLGAGVPPGECTAIAALPAVTDSGHTILAQNWDWLPHTTETLVVLEAEQDEGPSYVTVVEAGLLAKAGFNSCGVGVATNVLISAADVGEVGVPYHVTLRALLDAENLPAALASLQRCARSASANYLLAQIGGQAVDVEARPGDYSQLRLIAPSGWRARARERLPEHARRHRRGHLVDARQSLPLHAGAQPPRGPGGGGLGRDASAGLDRPRQSSRRHLRPRRSA